MHYYSTFPQGFLVLVKKILLQLDPKVKILGEGDNYIQYSSYISIDSIKSIDMFEQTFFLIKLFNENDFSFDNQIKWFSENSHYVNKRLRSLDKNRYLSFRIVGSAPNLENRDIQRSINTLNGLINLNNSNPDFDIRIVQKENHGFIGIRLTKPAEFKDELQRGSLRKEIASLMIYLSQPSEKDVFLDPFCGGGIIPILRSKISWFSHIIASDMDTDIISEKRLKYVKGTGKFTIIQTPAEQLSKNLHIKVNKIVTDPPWGNMENILNLGGLYTSMFDEFYAITSPNSTLVLLTPQIGIVEKYIKENDGKFILQEKFSGYVSGYPSNILKLKRI